MAAPDRSAPQDEAPQGALAWTAVLHGGLLLGGLGAFFFLLVEVREVMSPLLIAAAAAVLLWPLREHRVVRSLLLAGGFVLLYWLLNVTGDVLLPFAAVYLLAYLFDPLVSTAHRRWRVPRWIPSLALTLIVVGALVAIFVLLLPSIIGKLETLVEGLLQSLTGLQEWIMESKLVAYLDASGLVERAELEAKLTSVLPEQVGGIVGQIPVALQTLSRSVSTIIALITLVTLIPVLLFYTLRDFPTIERNLTLLFPKVGGDRAYLTRVGHVVGSYLRGQLAISAIAAVNVTVFLLLFGVPFAVLIGLLAGLLNMIPNIGVIITNVLGVAIALIFGTPVDALVVVLVLFGQQILEATILSPNIMSHQVGLHPVLVILSLLLFGSTMGFLGLVIAVPLTALLVTFYQTFRERMTLDLANTPGHHSPPASASAGTPPPLHDEPEARVEQDEGRA